MARFSFFALFLSCLALFAGPVLASNVDSCAKKNLNAINAISSFCQNRHIMTGSAWAKNGVWSRKIFDSKKAPHAVRVSIKGNCAKPIYVPTDVCQRQFYDMCAHGGPFGGNTRRYGYGNQPNCQEWQIFVQGVY